MINGAHCIIYSKDAEADRAFFKDVLGLPHVDVGRGVTTDAIANRGWGLLVNVHLPGGGTLGVYQPRHARPPSFDSAPR